MYKKYYSLKKNFGLHFRIGLLITLILLILGFIFFPEIERNTKLSDPETPNTKLSDPETPKLKRSKNQRGWDEISVVPPKPLNIDKLNFHYPEELRSIGIEGTVYLQLLIDKEGNVKNVILLKSVHPDLDKIAVENARKIKFSPNMQKGKPVAIWHSFPIKFKLE